MWWPVRSRASLAQCLRQQSRLVTSAWSLVVTWAWDTNTAPECHQPKDPFMNPSINKSLDVLMASGSFKGHSDQHVPPRQYGPHISTWSLVADHRHYLGLWCNSGHRHGHRPRHGPWWKPRQDLTITSSYSPVPLSHEFSSSTFLPWLHFLFHLSIVYSIFLISLSYICLLQQCPRQVLG